LEKTKRPVEKTKRSKQPVPSSEQGYNAVEWATFSISLGQQWGRWWGITRQGLSRWLLAQMYGYVRCELDDTNITNFFSLLPYDPNARWFHLPPFKSVGPDGFSATVFVQANTTSQWRMR